MDTINITKETELAAENLQKEEDFNDDFFEDEKVRKPKGKKIKKMKSFYDK